MERKQWYRGAMTVLLLGVVLLCAACSHMDRADNNQVVYRYDFPTVSKTHYAPGGTITMTWKAIATNDTTPTAYPIVLSAALTRGQNGSGEALDRETITTDNWSGKDYTMTVQVPKKIAAGIFYLTQSSTLKATGGFKTISAAGTIVMVQP